jgi:hypothetical protein
MKYIDHGEEMSDSKQCPKCNRQMTCGAVRDDNILQWGHVKEGSIFGVKTIHVIPPIYFVDAYRCDQCGYLELYATREQGK